MNVAARILNTGHTQLHSSLYEPPAQHSHYKVGKHGKIKRKEFKKFEKYKDKKFKMKKRSVNALSSRVDEGDFIDFG